MSDRPKIQILVDPGEATAQEIADLLVAISELSKALTGSHLTFEVKEVRE